MIFSFCILYSSQLKKMSSTNNTVQNKSTGQTFHSALMEKNKTVMYEQAQKRINEQIMSKRLIILTALLFLLVMCCYICYNNCMFLVLWLSLTNQNGVKTNINNYRNYLFKNIQNEQEKQFRTLIKEQGKQRKKSTATIWDMFSMKNIVNKITDGCHKSLTDNLQKFVDNTIEFFKKKEEYMENNQTEQLDAESVSLTLKGKLLVLWCNLMYYLPAYLCLFTMIVCCGLLFSYMVKSRNITHSPEQLEQILKQQQLQLKQHKEQEIKNKLQKKQHFKEKRQKIIEEDMKAEKMGQIAPTIKNKLLRLYKRFLKKQALQEELRKKHQKNKKNNIILTAIDIYQNENFNNKN